MKELTIEQKAKAYDEAIKRGLDYIRHTPATEMVTRQDIFEAIFPEFKESEDERLRKEIISALKYANHNGVYDKHLAWLEKQGDKDKLIQELGEYKVKYTQEVLSQYLEKQGEQKHKIQPKFKIGDIIRFKGNETLKGEVEAHKIVGYDNELYVFADGTTDLFCEQDLYELVEQNPAWSEEDEKYLQELIEWIDCFIDDEDCGDMTYDEHKEFYTTRINWLKSLKERIGE